MIPTYEQFMIPVLQVLSDGRAYKTKGLRGALQKLCSLSDEDMNVQKQSGGSKVGNNISWACTYLRHAGLVRHSDRGIYEITEEGKTLLKSGCKSLTKAYLEAHYPSLYEFTHRKRSDSTETTMEGAMAKGSMDLTSEARLPEDIIKDNLHLLMENLIDKLLEAVRNIHPRHFEQLVVDLMLKMGYGGEDEKSGIVTKYTADGGIDGEIKEDILGLGTIFIQAKRYAENNKVDRPTLQSFVGALDGKHSKKGVFITTSSFTAQAEDYARSTSARIILIDGRQLCHYMIQFNLGVVVKETLLLKQLDQNYFTTED